MIDGPPTTKTYTCTKRAYAAKYCELRVGTQCLASRIANREGAIYFKDFIIIRALNADYRVARSIISALLYDISLRNKTSSSPCR